MASRVKKGKKTTRRTRKGSKKTMKMRSKRGGNPQDYTTTTRGKRTRYDDDTITETMQQCKRRGRSKGHEITTKQLDVNQGSKGYDKHTSMLLTTAGQNIIKKFVELIIQPGPQIITFPMQPYSHSILVDVQPENKRIMISDWILLTGYDDVAGLRSLKERFHDTTDEEEVLKHQDYKHILELLTEKYPYYKIIYYPVDVEMKRKIWQELGPKKFGGCSQYIYDWVDTYYPDGVNYIGPEISERRGNVYYARSL